MKNKSYYKNLYFINVFLISGNCTYNFISLVTGSIDLVLPASKITIPIIVDTHMVTAVDKLPLKGNTPVPEEIKPPIPICIKPSKADALPAFFEKGAIESADAFGKVNPWQLRKRSNKMMVPARPVIPA